MRLIIRFDFDGILCAAMIQEIKEISEILFANPKDIEERPLKISFTKGDAIAHLPFYPGAGVWFHNHDYVDLRSDDVAGVKGRWEDAPSSSSLIQKYYAPALEKYKKLVEVANRIGRAKLTVEDVFDPQGWMLIHYTLDPRFSKDHEYGMLILNEIRSGKSAEEVLKNEIVAERVVRYKDDEKKYTDLLAENTQLHGNVIVTDWRKVDLPPHGNRFIVFQRYPDGNVHIRVDKPDDDGMYKISVSKSIFTRGLKIHLGELMEMYGGGGLRGAGTCVLDKDGLDARIEQMISTLRS